MYYEEACKEQDRQGISDVGLCIDRRTLAHLREEYQEGSVKTLFTLLCVLCSEKKAFLLGADRFGRPGNKGELSDRTLRDL